jgi:hypothetical protein
VHGFLVASGKNNETQMAVPLMVNLWNYPLFVFAFSLLTFWISAWIGASFRNMQEDSREDFAAALGGTLTLLGLIIGFTFSMAVSRYDQRKNYEEQEANAIGTEYVRVDLLAATDAVKAHALLMDYLNQRILHYEARNEEQLRQINAQTARLQAEMWSVVKTPAATQPTPVASLILAGMNDVLNSQGYAQAAWLNRIPAAAWTLLMSIAIFSNLLTGYSARGRSPFLFMVLPLALSISLCLIADIDSPRGGVIHVQPQNLQILLEYLHLR